MEPVPPPDPRVEPEGFVVVVEPGDRIHFLDWGGPRGDGPASLLIHGLSNTAWSWAPVARRLRAVRHVVAMDLRGHGLSDAPTDGYDPDTMAEDVIAVAEGSGLLEADDDRVVLAGHGFGAIVAAWAAVALGERCAGLVLVDGGWEVLEDATGIDVDEFLRGLDEPPEVMRSMAAFLADRAAFDPATWDADQERAARASVVETHAGKVVPATRPHAVEASVRAMFRYDPLATLASVEAPVIALRGRGRRRRLRERAPSPPRPTRARRAGRGRDPRRVVRARRAQPDAVPSRGGQRGDPVGRRQTGSEGRVACRSSTRRRTSGTTSRSRRSWASPIPANEVAERAERIRTRWRPTAASTFTEPTEHGEAPITAVHDPGLVRFLEVAWSEVRRQAIDRPFLSADTYPNRSMFEGMSRRGRRGARARAGAGRRPGGLLGPRFGRAARGRDLRRGARRPSTSR